MNQSKAQALRCNLNNKAVGQAIPAVSFNGEVIERTNTDVQDADRINSGARKDCHGFKRHRTTSSVPAVSECMTQRH